MDKTWAHIVEWYDGENGPFRQGYDDKERADEHAALVRGQVLDGNTLVSEPATPEETPAATD